MRRTSVLILGAAGRDFHNFNLVYRADARFKVVGFTAAQIPRIAERRYPPDLSGPLYPSGVPIFAEADLERIIDERGVDVVVMAYSDVSHGEVMHLASRAIARGADFVLLGAQRTMLTAEVPVIAVCAVRTGCGKSQTARYIAKELRALDVRVVAVRHPMPYGDLGRQRVERLATYGDLEAYDCTIEEREEYEAYLSMGIVVYAGVDYGAILEQAQDQAQVLIWDGGNNDLPFVRPDLWITVADPLRPGHELAYHPGEANFRAADVIIINKVRSADRDAVAQVEANARTINPSATVIHARSTVIADRPELIRGRRVLLIEDGPTLTHGGMPYGAGSVAARECGALSVVDPRPFAKGSIRGVYDTFPHIGDLVPAMGYYPEQIRELEETIAAADCDTVVVATPIDLARLIHISKPTVRVRYELEETGEPTLRDQVAAFVTKRLHR